MRRRFSVVDLAARAVLSAFDRLTGLHLLGDVQAFVRSFDGMYAGFAERAGRAQRLLVASDTAVVVVTTAEPGRFAQAHEFLDALRAAGIEPRAVIVNRTLPAIPSVAQIGRAPLGPALRRKLIRAAGEFAALRQREAAAIASLRAGGRRDWSSPRCPISDESRPNLPTSPGWGRVWKFYKMRCERTNFAKGGPGQQGQ